MVGRCSLGAKLCRLGRNFPKSVRNGAWILLFIVSAFWGKGAMAINGSTHLFLVGGGYVPDKVISRMLDLAKAKDSGKTPRVLIIAWATEEPQDAYERISKRVVLLGPVEIQKAPDPENLVTPEQRKDFLDLVAWATCIFFTGGSQNRIMDLFALDSVMVDTFRTKYLHGFPIGGTSAGMAIMSSKMFTGEGDFEVINPKKVTIRESLGFITNALVDTHFLEKKRANRLFSVLLGGAAKLGLGVDVDSALEVTDDLIAENIGPELVMAVDAVEHPGKLLVELINPGDVYDLIKRTKIRASSVPSSPELAAEIK